MAAKALFNAVMNVRDLDRSAQFYETLGMERQYGFDLREGENVPPEYYEARDVDPARAGPSVSLCFPFEPFMHLQLQSWRGEPVRGGWPPKFDQLGTRAVGLLVDDVAAELAALRDRGVLIVQEPITIMKKWGPTTVGLVRDPDGNFLELFAVDWDEHWDTSTRSVIGADRRHLHFQMNTENRAELHEFYSAFGWEDDKMVNPRPGAENPGSEQSPNAVLHPWDADSHYERVFGFPFFAGLEADVDGACNFLRLPGDHSHMHLEILGWKDGTLKDPDVVPTLNQKGIVRHCFRATGVADLVAEHKRRGTKIFLEEQTLHARWGDTEWFFFGDPDGNVTCMEEWFPALHWGERF